MSAYRSFCEGIDIFGEALATVAELAVGTGDVGVGVVDIAGEEHTGVYLAPVAAHLLAVLAAGIEVGYLIGSEHVECILAKIQMSKPLNLVPSTSTHTHSRNSGHTNWMRDATGLDRCQSRTLPPLPSAKCIAPYP